MNSDNGRIYYKISIDKSQLKADAQNVKNEFRSISSTVQSEGEKMDQIFNRTYKSALALFSLNEIRKFSNEIIGITGEFQQLNVAFETILNSKEKADQLMSQVVSFASTTPFQLTDTAQATKQLLAYGFASQDIIKDLRMLGDVASGVSAPIQDLVYLYGTLKTQGRAYTRDIMQFTSRGIPIIQQLANVMGVTEDKVQGLVEAGKVGFPEVEKAFQNLTQQGGMFYNLMDKQSKTITGQISNLEDNLDKMFNDIGSANEGLIDGSISGLNELINHYQDVLDIIKMLVASYGTYKAALLVVTAAEKIRNATTITETVQGAIKMVTVTRQMTAAEIAQTAAQKALNTVMSMNPYVAATVAITTLFTAISIWGNKTKTVQDRVDDLNKSVDEINHQTHINDLIYEYDELTQKQERSSSEQKQLNSTIQELSTIFPDAIDKVDEYGNTIDLIQTKLINANKELQNYLKTNTKSQIQDDQETLKTLQTRLNSLLKEVNTGKRKVTYTTTAGPGGMGQQTYTKTEKLGSKIIDEDKGKIAEINKQISDLSKSIQKGQKALSSLTKISTDRILAPYKNLFKELDGLTDKELNDLKTKLSSLLSKGLGEDATTKINLQIKAIDKQLAMPTVKEQIETVKKKLEEAKATLKSLYEPDSKATDKQRKDQKDLVSTLSKSFKDLTQTEKGQSKKQLKIKQQKLDAVKELNNQEIQLEASKNKALIAMMNDGIAKQKATLKNNYQDLLTQYAQQEQSILNSINKKNNKKQGDSGYATSLSSYIESNPDDKKAATAYQSLLDLKMLADKKYLQDTEALDQKAAQSIKAIMNEVQERFLSDLDQRKKAINDYYDGKIKEAKAQNASQATIDELNKDRVLELNQTQSESAYKLSSFYKEAFGNIGKYGAATLKKLQSDIDAVINSAKQIKVGGQSMVQLEIPTDQIDKDGKKIKKTVNMTIEEFTELQKQANEVNNSVDQNNPFSAITKNFKQVQKAFKSGDKTGIAEAMETLNSSISDGSQLVNQWGDSLGQIFGSDVSDDIQLLTGLTQGVTNLGTGVTELASGDIVGGITNTLKGVAKIYSTLTKGAKEYHKAVKDYTEELLKLQLEYNKALNEQIQTQSDGTSVFYTDYTAEIQDASKAASQAIEQINKELSGSSIESFLSDLQIKTGVAKKKFLGITTGTKDIYGSLGENFNKVLSDAGYSFDQLIDDSGNLNTNLAQTISDSGLLDDASQEALDSLIEYQEEYDDAIEDVKNSLKEVVGSLSDDLYSAVNDAWIDGSDNATAFFDVVNEGLENMVSQIIYTASFSGLFDELQDNLTAIYTNANLSSDEMSSQISSAIYNFYDEASDAMDNYTAGMDIASQTAESMGFDWSDIDTDSSRSGSTSGVESMTQDSADEMNGRLTAIQGMVSTINTNISILIDSNSKILIHMVNIDTNTARLESIETSLTAVKKGIDTINTRGITIK